MENYERIYQDIKKNNKRLKKNNEDLFKKKTLKNEQKSLIYDYLINGNIKSRDLLIESNLKLCIKMAKKFTDITSKTDFFDDFISVGFLESIECIERYVVDHKKGNKISDASVSTWIRNNVNYALIRYMKEKGNVIKLQSTYIDDINDEKTAIECFIKENHRLPMNGEEYIITKIKNKRNNIQEKYKKKIIFGKKNQFTNISLNEINNNDGYNNYLEKEINDKYDDDNISLNSYEYIQNKKEITNILNESITELNDIERDIISLKFNENLNNKQISYLLNYKTDKQLLKMLKTGKNVIKVKYEDGCVEIINAYCFNYKIKYISDDIYNKRTKINDVLCDEIYIKPYEQIIITSESPIHSITLNKKDMLYNNVNLNNFLLKNTKIGYFFNVNEINNKYKTLITKLRKDKNIYKLWELMN